MLADSHRDDRTRTISLRLRLTVWVVAVFLLIQLLTGGVFWWLRRGEADRMFQQRLFEHAGALAARVERELPAVTEEFLDTVGAQSVDVLQFPWIEIDIVDTSGESSVRDTPHWPSAARRLLSMREHGEEFLWLYLDDDASLGNPISSGRVVVVGIPLASETHPGLMLIVSTADTFFVEQARLLTRVLLSAGLIGLAASAVSGWLIAGIAVAPLHKLSKLAGELGPETIEEPLDLNDTSSEVHMLTHELDEARSRIREAFAAQERFLSNISHEIKTPIATILLECQTINRAGLSAEGIEFVDTAESEMRKLGELVESFLTLTRVRNGGKPVHLKRYLANELVMDAVEDCLAYADDYGVRLNPSLNASEETIDVRLVGDATLLRTMLNNLIRNAVRFSKPDDEVRIEACCQGDRFVIEVRDSGPGLPDEIIPDIFDRFVQSKPEVSRERGQGLGLAIAKGIAELHDGDIIAANRADGGAVFTITLPVASDPI